MSKNFEEIFTRMYEPVKNTDENYTHMTLDITGDAQELVVYVLMNEGALRERDRIREILLQVDASWVTYALAEIDKIPRDLPRDG